ncbi:hypothetical protein DCS_01347 [Drechmeria coniospora]|uniref:Uncharacterized protein n=1 Tax=Drechmeria coniospora TaxID=98403 RepID=A0A151GT16_DRECN|nr:hypothetical protein DCS_01347 [Drechmeria coniospora]KYK60211.1 hypothetical protein DCS_01347 [Drechmeria coniospora]
MNCQYQDQFNTFIGKTSGSATNGQAGFMLSDGEAGWRSSGHGSTYLQRCLIDAVVRIADDVDFGGVSHFSRTGLLVHEMLPQMPRR